MSIFVGYCPVSGKQCYRNGQEAYKALRAVNQRKKGNGVIYVCRFCDRWHLSSHSRQGGKMR